MEKKIKKIKDDIYMYNEIYFQLQGLGLNMTEKSLMGLYLFKSKGNLHKCVYTNKQIADMFEVTERTIISANNHLKELNLIKVKGRSVTCLWFPKDIRNDEENEVKK